MHLFSVVAAWKRAIQVSIDSYNVSNLFSSCFLISSFVRFLEGLIATVLADKC